MSHSSTPVGRRSVLALGGSLAAVGLFGAACGGNTGRGSSSSSSAGGGVEGHHGDAPAVVPPVRRGRHAAGGREVRRRRTRTPRSTCSGAPATTTRRPPSALLTDSGPDVFEYGNGPSIDMIKGNQVVDLDRPPRRREVRLHPGPRRADDLPGQAVRHPAGHRHAAAGLPQEHAREGRRAAAADRRRADRRREDADHRARSRASSSATTAASGVLGGPLLWSAGLDYLTKDNTVRLRRPRRAPRRSASCASCSPASPCCSARPPTGPTRRRSRQGLTAMQWTGLWTLPDHQEGPRRRLRRAALARAQRPGGKPSVPVGAYGVVRQRQEPERRRRQGVRQVAVGRPDRQPAGLRASRTASTSRPARASRPRRDKLKSGPAADAARFVNENGHAQTPLLWTPKTRNGVLRRADPHRQGAAPTPGARSPRSRRSPTPSSSASPADPAGATA